MFRDSCAGSVPCGADEFLLRNGRQAQWRESLQTSPPSKGCAPIVFVVHSDCSTRELLESLIRSAGWVPRTFASAQAFLADEPVHAPGCLVLDIALPDLTGLELQKLIAGRRVGLPVVFVTGSVDVQMAVCA